MNKQEMKAEMVRNITSQIGYSYSEKKLDEALERGIVEGDVLIANHQMKVVVEGTNAIARNAKGEQVGPAMDLTNADNMSKCVMMYALKYCQVGYTCGR